MCRLDPGAENLFYIDVWRSAQREALQIINDQLPEGTERVRVFACGSTLNFERFPRLAAWGDPNDRFDYVIQLPRCSPTKAPNLQVIGEVRRQGVLFATVLRAQSPS